MPVAIVEIFNTRVYPSESSTRCRCSPWPTTQSMSSTVVAIRTLSVLTASDDDLFQKWMRLAYETLLTYRQRCCFQFRTGEVKRRARWTAFRVFQISLRAKGTDGSPAPAVKPYVLR